MAIFTDIQDFALANPLYAGASVAFFTVDPALLTATAALAPLFNDQLGAVPAANPQILDSLGKFAAPLYCGVAVIAQVTGINGPSHATGIIFPEGSFRGAWATGTVYYPGDVVVDGANGTNTTNLYFVVGMHLSGVWAADSANAAKLLLYLAGAQSAAASATAAAASATAASGSATAAAASAAAAGAGRPPGGRLTLTSGAPVMTADVTAASTVFYTPHVGASCPIFGGASFAAIAFAETQLILDAAGHLSGKNYDVFAWNNGGTLALGTGPAWSSDTARGAGAGTTELQMISGFWTNKNAAVLRNNSINTAAIAANQATYLGTIRATANGQTGAQFKPNSGAGGSNTIVGLWNAFNRVRVKTRSLDVTGTWTYGVNTWRPANNNNSNRISYIDGLAQSSIDASYLVFANSSGGNGQVGIQFNAVSGTPAIISAIVTGEAGTLIVSDAFQPSLGFNFVQAMELSTAASTTFSGAGFQQLQAGLEY